YPLDYYSVSRMGHSRLYSAILVLSSIAGAVAQTASPTSNPLDQFIGAAHTVAGAVDSANARQTAAPPTSTSPSPTSSTPAAITSPTATAAASKPGSDHKTLIIAVVCAVVGALFVALLVGVCCWCIIRRRRRRHAHAQASIDDEVKTWRSNEPANPGRQYSNPSKSGPVSTAEQQPMIPVGAKEPDLRHHPALRNENPFVPVPPSPRRAPNSRPGLTDDTVPGAPPYVVPETQRLRKSSSRSRSRPRTGSNSNLPTTNTASRPSTPFGLSGIGQPYEDMHVHVLRTDAPSRELQQSLNNREPIYYPTAEPVQRHDTPPTVPSRSPNRLSQSQSQSQSPGLNHGYTISTAATTPDASSTEDSSADDWRYNKQAQFSSVAPWEMRQNRYADNAAMMQAPPIPWSEREWSRQSPSHSPRHSSNWPRHSDSGGETPYVNRSRRNSRSPATSVNGQPKRLRFSDLQGDEVGPYDQQRYSQGVGEAL
ncbi:MAG: hypothetical protein Q9167_000705, partial [Letrouitia subvulpina]